jgi:hypothetical protein
MLLYDSHRGQQSKTTKGPNSSRPSRPLPREPLPMPPQQPTPTGPVTLNASHLAELDQLLGYYWSWITGGACVILGDLEVLLLRPDRRESFERVWRDFFEHEGSKPHLWKRGNDTLRARFVKIYTLAQPSAAEGSTGPGQDLTTAPPASLPTSGSITLNPNQVVDIFQRIDNMAERVHTALRAVEPVLKDLHDNPNKPDIITPAKSKVEAQISALVAELTEFLSRCRTIHGLERI